MSLNIIPVASEYQEIHPYSAMNIDSVKINTSLIMMRECSVWFSEQFCITEQSSEQCTHCALVMFNLVAFLVIVPPEKMPTQLSGKKPEIRLWRQFRLGPSLAHTRTHSAHSQLQLFTEVRGQEKYGSSAQLYKSSQDHCQHIRS